MNQGKLKFIIIVLFLGFKYNGGQKIGAVSILKKMLYSEIIENDNGFWTRK